MIVRKAHTIKYGEFYAMEEEERQEWVLVRDDPNELRMTVRPRRPDEPLTDWGKVQVPK